MSLSISHLATSRTLPITLPIYEFWGHKISYWNYPRCCEMRDGMRDGKFKIINWRGFCGNWMLISLERALTHVRGGPASPGGAAERVRGLVARCRPRGKPSINNQPIDAADIGLVDLRVPGPPTEAPPGTQNKGG